MCRLRIGGIKRKPFNLPQNTTDQDIGYCQEDSYYLHEECGNRYCMRCIRNHRNEGEQYFLVYYHVAIIGIAPRSLTCCICADSLTVSRPINECRPCFATFRANRIGNTEVIIDEESIAVNAAVRV